MTEKEIEIMAFMCEDIEQYVNSRLREALDQHEKHLVINVMLNISTSILSKVLLMAGPDMRQSVMQTAISITHDKTKDGDEMIQEMLKTLKPKGRADTCYPDLNRKH